MRKKIISMGAALVLMLSVGITASAGHHMSCVGRVIQNSSLCWHSLSHDRGHHLFCYGSGQDCAYWDMDLSGICDYWEDCHGGAAYREQSADRAAQSSPNVVQPAPNTVPENQPGQSGTGSAAESQPGAAQEAGDQAQPQTGYGTDAAGAEAYGAYNGYSYGNGTGYGNGGYCNRGGYTTGCHGSGHHGHGHH